MRAKVLSLIAVSSMAAQATAADRPPPARTVTAIVQCRAISDNARRLACFDSAAKALADAVATDQVYVFDKAEVRKSRRQGFGLAVSDPFQSKDGTSPTPSTLSTTVHSAMQQADGNWLISMSEGGLWVQTDAAPLARSPKPGMAIVISKGALGSFRLTVAGQSGGRVRRLQ